MLWFLFKNSRAAIHIPTLYYNLILRLLIGAQQQIHTALAAFKSICHYTVFSPTLYPSTCPPLLFAILLFLACSSHMLISV